MSVAHIPIDRTKPDSMDLMNVLNQLKGVYQNLPYIIRVMQQMIDGDGTDVAQFDMVASKYGTSGNVNAKALWDELNSINFKLGTDATQDHVASAIVQALTKIGN